jgi:hypothetical protein
METDHMRVNQSIAYLRNLAESARVNGVKVPSDALSSLSKAEQAILASQKYHDTGDDFNAQTSMDAALLRAKHFVSLAGMGEEELDTLSAPGVKYLEESDASEDLIHRHSHPHHEMSEDY